MSSNSQSRINGAIISPTSNDKSSDRDLHTFITNTISNALSSLPTINNITRNTNMDAYKFKRRRSQSSSSSSTTSSFTQEEEEINQLYKQYSQLCTLYRRSEWTQETPKDNHRCSSVECSFINGYTLKNGTGHIYICLSSGNIHYCTDTLCTRKIKDDIFDPDVCELTGIVYATYQLVGENGMNEKEFTSTKQYDWMRVMKLKWNQTITARKRYKQTLITEPSLLLLSGQREDALPVSVPIVDDAPVPELLRIPLQEEANQLSIVCHEALQEDMVYNEHHILESEIHSYLAWIPMIKDLSDQDLYVLNKTIIQYWIDMKDYQSKKYTLAVHFLVVLYNARNDGITVKGQILVPFIRYLADHLPTENELSKQFKTSFVSLKSPKRKRSPKSDTTTSSSFTRMSDACSYLDQAKKIFHTYLRTLV